jgi:uncharacterized protein YodC (DUF2158 family)
MTKPKTNMPPRAGDVVAIKSGSPRMTLIAVKGDTASVLWSDFNTKDICRDEFPLVALMRLKQEQGAN